MESKLAAAAAAVGLKILTTNTKAGINQCSNPPIFRRNQIVPPANNCFLKSCFLCHKHLPLNKEVYMYRGDQGFCSEACRSRQIYIDDVTQLEISTKKMMMMMMMRRQSLIARCKSSNNNKNNNPRLRKTSMAASPCISS